MNKALFFFLIACGAAKAKPAIQEIGNIDVTQPPYNAKGDGKTDDTAAIQKALDDTAAAGGGIVFLPTGIYRVATHLSVGPSTTLKGVFDGPPNLEYAHFEPLTIGHGTMLQVEESAGSDSATAFITMNGYGSGIDGMMFFYPNQTVTNPPVKYPWTIAIGINPGAEYSAYDVTIQNINLGNAYQGIDFASQVSSRHIISNIYGQPLYRGIQIDKCYDFCEMHNTHFDPFWSVDPALTAFTQQYGIAYDFYRADGEIMSDINAHGYDIGIRFQHEPGQITYGTYASITNLDFDGCNIGIDAIDTASTGLNISNYGFASGPADGPDQIGVYLPSAGSDQGSLITITNANFNGRVIRAEQAFGSISLNSARIGPTANPNPRIDVLGGQAIITDNIFPLAAGADGTDPYVAVHLASPVGQAIVTGNMLGKGTVVVDAGGGVPPVVANNFALPP